MKDLKELKKCTGAQGLDKIKFVSGRNFWIGNLNGV